MRRPYTARAPPRISTTPDTERAPMWNNDTPSRTSTPQHRQWRERVLKRDQYQCQLRYPNKCITTATEADHIVEVADGGAEYAPTNGQAACVPCHRSKTTTHANNKRWAKRDDKHPREQHPGLN